MAYCPTHLALFPNVDKRNSHVTARPPAPPRRRLSHIGSLLTLPADAPPHPWLSKARKIEFEEDTIEVFEIATATTIRKVKPGEVKPYTVVPRKKKLVEHILERVKSLGDAKPPPTLPVRRASFPMRKSFSLPSVLSPTAEGWSLPVEAKAITLDAIQQIDKFFSQLAVLEDSPQRQSMTAAFQRAKAALMKKLGIESFGEYLELEGTIRKEMDVVKKAQTELLVLRHLGIEGDGAIDEDGAEVGHVSSEIRRGLVDIGGFF
jgi:hypothetical protein